jgi:hypothetical protein
MVMNKDLIDKNPLRALYKEHSVPRMGLVMARAGLGKTAILVQIALDSLLCGHQVLHVSIGQNLEKTKTWYDDIFKDIVASLEASNQAELQDQISRNRLIMTFKESTFSRPKLEERLNDLIYQNIFRPTTMIIDGFDFTDCDRQIISDIRELAEATEMAVWFSAVSHRDAMKEGDKDIPFPCENLADLFDTIILLKPEADEKCIALNLLKDTKGDTATGKILNLDPATLLIKEPYDKC